MRLRETKGLTQKNVAEMCGISRSFYADIEHGTRNPKVSTAKVIGTFLGFDWTLFFETNGRKTRQSREKTA
jgi:transcriptional regulator with XRE-family HTH domain